MSIHNVYTKLLIIMTTTNILIEKGIKVPSSKRSKYPFSEMKKGDSIDLGEYTSEKSRSVWGSICFFKKQKRNGSKQFSCRKTDEGRIRIWRTK